MPRQIVVEIVGDAGKFTSAARISVSEAGKMQSAMQGVFQGIGQMATKFAVRGVEAIVDSIGDSVKAASDLREAQALTSQVFEENTAAMEDWARSASDAFGQSQREALQYAANFGTAFKSVGMDMEEVADRAQTMTRLAADLGSAFNTSSDEAARALRSGLMGESEPMRRFGVFLSEAAVAAKAVELGIAGAGQELTATQKVAARYAIIMEQTADSQGMFGRDTESLADAQKSLGAEMENLSAELGQQLLPLMVDLTRWVRDEGLPAFRDFMDALGVLGSLFDSTGDTVTDFRRDAQETGIFWQLTGQQMVDAVAGVHAAARDGFVGAGQYAQRAAGDMGDLGDAAGEMADDTEQATDKATRSVADMRNQMRSMIRELIDGTYDPLRDALELRSLDFEEAAQRAILADTESTEEQRVNAQRRLLDIEAERIELRTLMAVHGELKGSTSDVARFLMSEWAKASGSARDDIMDMIRSLDQYRDAVAKVPGVPSYQPGKNPQQHRASGGPVAAMAPYIVGEAGPELFVPSTSGSILPNHAMDWGAPSAMGGMVLNLTVNASPGMTPGAAAELGEALGPAIVGYLGRVGALPGMRA